jgi:hypothetical protein
MLLEVFNAYDSAAVEGCGRGGEDMKKVMFFLIFMFYALTVFAGHAIPFPDIYKPVWITVEDDKLYISERATIYVYSLKDFKLKQTIGREGEGPREFKRYAVIDILPNSILVNSLGKISHLSKDGKFIKEVRVKSEVANLKSLGENFVGRAFRITRKGKEKMNYKVLNLYNPELLKIKEVFKQELDMQQGKGTKLFHLSFSYKTYANRLYVAGRHDFIIDVFDAEGNKLFSITHPYKKLKFNSEHKKQLYESIRMRGRDVEKWKKIGILPKYFPAIRHLSVTDDTIYVQTYKKRGAAYELFLFDLKGKLKKRLFLPCVDRYFMAPFPFTFKNNKIYQLAENEETERLELRIHEIK